MSLSARYSQHEVVQLASDIRKKFLTLKNEIHTKDVRLQQSVPTPKELISQAKVFTQMRDMAARALSNLERKKAKSTKKEPAQLELVRIDDTLAKFLLLEERGFEPIYDQDGNKTWYYSGNLTLSYFTNWVVANNRQSGKEVILHGLDDPFVQLFYDDLTKVGLIGEGKAILDTDGTQLNKFISNMHMTIFANHYPKKMSIVGKEYKMARIKISRDEYPHIYDRMEKERTLLTGEMKKVRKEYIDALKAHERLLAKKDKADQVGDDSIDIHIRKARDNVIIKTRAYMRLLNLNKLQHSISIPRF